jgi:hypothetical protein
MNILLPVVSILALTSAAWLAARALRASLCPICIGVGATWLWMLAARFAGLPVDGAMLAILLGASVLGAAGAIESRLPPGRSLLLWKACALPIGFVAAYGLAAERWGMAAAGALAFALLAGFFLRPRRAAGDAAVVGKLEQEMKKCC